MYVDLLSNLRRTSEMIFSIEKVVNYIWVYEYLIDILNYINFIDYILLDL